MAHAEKPAGNRGVSTLEAEMEQTRQRLAGTIDQLVHRASPKTVAQRNLKGLKAVFVTPEGGVRVDTVIKIVGGVAGTAALAFTLRKIVK